MMLDEIKILLVEDNLADAVLIERQIKKIVKNPKVIHMSDFASFKDSMKNDFYPDVILCDYNLKGFTGFEVLEFMTTLPDNSKYTPIIFVTGTIKDNEIAENSILADVSGYILKKELSSLHEKLLPYLQKIISTKKEGLSRNLKMNKMQLEDAQVHLKQINEENELIRLYSQKMKKEIDEMKNNKK